MRLILRLYPASFRARHGDELAETIASDPLTLAVVRDVVAAASDCGARQLARSLPDAQLRRRGRRAFHRPSKRTAMETIVQDLRYALRQFIHRPGFTAIAVLSLGLAIGGNSLIYGMVDGFVFRPFRIRIPIGSWRLASRFRSCRQRSTYVETLSPAEYLDIRERELRAHRVVRSRQPQHHRR